MIAAASVVALSFQLPSAPTGREGGRARAPAMLAPELTGMLTISSELNGMLSPDTLAALPPDFLPADYAATAAAAAETHTPFSRHLLNVASGYIGFDMVRTFMPLSLIHI